MFVKYTEMKENWQLIGDPRIFSEKELKCIVECKVKCSAGLYGSDIRLYVTICIDGKKRFLTDDIEEENGIRGILLDKTSIKRLNLNNGEERDVNPAKCLFYSLKNNNDDRIIKRVRILSEEVNEPTLHKKGTSWTCKKNYGIVNVAKNASHQFGVIDNEGNVIVPFGKYGWIDGFDSGLARVHSHAFPDGKKRLLQMYKWGIINEEGEEVLPLEYDDIWNFKGKNRYSTKVIKGDEETEVYFHNLNPSLPIRGAGRYCNIESNSCGDNESRKHYGEYAGSYVQDEMGYSDEDINDAFDGDPDAYWNID